MAGGLQQATGNQLGAIGNNLGNLQRRDISLLGSVGGAQRNMNQAINDLAYQNFVGQYNLPQNLLGQYSGIFSDLTNSAAAFNEFVKQAHTNLSTEQLTQLAYDIFNQYQDMDESGGT